MNESKATGEQGIGSIVEQVIAGVLKKEHEANLQISKQFAGTALSWVSLAA
jgi:hypothetical protein